MPKRSAGLLVYCQNLDSTVHVIAVHPGGPFARNRDDGAWSIPKGEYEPNEDPLATAYREFTEELGKEAPNGMPVPLGEVKQAGGKRVIAWALECAAGSIDLADFTSNTFELEWPPRSGRVQTYPEVDRAEWFTIEVRAA